MKAREAMTTPVISVNIGTPLREVASIMQEKRISGMPVLDQDGTMIGIITEFDLIKTGQRMRVVGLADCRGWISPTTPVDHIARFVEGLATIGDIKVEDVMTRTVFTVDGDDSLEDVARLIVKRGISRAPVMDGQRVIGIITRTDVLNAIVQMVQ